MGGWNLFLDHLDPEWIQPLIQSPEGAAVIIPRVAESGRNKSLTSSGLETLRDSVGVSHADLLPWLTCCLFCLEKGGFTMNRYIIDTCMTCSSNRGPLQPSLFPTFSSIPLVFTASIKIRGGETMGLMKEGSKKLAEVVLKRGV